MEKLKMHSPDLTQEKIAKIRELLPDCVTEAKDENGKLRYAVDFDQLRQELSDHIVEGPQERYHLNWPGKREALLAANAPIAKTLRPCREESVDFDTTQNLFIEGDNLEALKLLQETYLGRIKMIYIDPPYNTGKDFIYDDDFLSGLDDYFVRSFQKNENGSKLVANTESNGRFHSDWLSMIYPRIKLARNLLSNNGVFCISIDDNEVSSLRKICDEIFGRENFITGIMWKRKKEISSDSKNVSIQGEHILVYGKSSDTVLFSEPLSDSYIEKSYKAATKEFPDGKWRPVPITVSKGLSGGGYEYTIETPTGKKHTRVWAYPKAGYERLLKENRVYFGVSGDGVPQRVIYAHESRGQPTTNYWDNLTTNKEGKKEIIDLFRDNVFDTPKPTKLIQKLCELSCSENDIILDFFAGSASAAHAVLNANAKDGGHRKFILVQMKEIVQEGSVADKNGFSDIAEIAKERIRRAGKKMLGGETNPNWDKDVGFRVLKIDTSNMSDVYYTPSEAKQEDLLSAVDNIKEGRDSPEDLLFQVLVDWGVDLTLPIRSETVQGKTVFFVNEEPYDLIACFDTGVTEELVKELAKHEPVRVVFRDNGFASDAVKINVEQIFRQLSPATDVKSI